MTTVKVDGVVRKQSATDRATARLLREVATAVEAGVDGDTRAAAWNLVEVAALRAACMNEIHDHAEGELSHAARLVALRYDPPTSQAVNDFSALDRARLVNFGTCADCPYVGDYKRPDLCRHVERYDHNLEPRPAQMAELRRGVRRLVASLEAVEDEVVERCARAVEALPEGSWGDESGERCPWPIAARVVRSVRGGA